MKVAALPITQWNYKVEEDHIKHIGPVAQDFYAAFGLGADDITIATLDEAGVALLAIQALEMRTRELRVAMAELKDVNTELAALRAENSEMKTKMAQFESTLQRLEALTASLENGEASGTTVAEVTP